MLGTPIGRQLPLKLVPFSHISQPYWVGLTTAVYLSLDVIPALLQPLGNKTALKVSAPSTILMSVYCLLHTAVLSAVRVSEVDNGPVGASVIEISCDCSGAVCRGWLL